MTTLIRTYKVFTSWMSKQSIVNVITKKSGQPNAETQIRKPASLLTLLSITSGSEPISETLLVHNVEQKEGKWVINAGGVYREVRPGIYHLFETISFTIWPIEETALSFLQCPYCQALLFGVDKEICSHQFLRFNNNEYWAPDVDEMLSELSQKLKRTLTVTEDFKKFLITNPQLDWKRMVHYEDGIDGSTEVMVFASENPKELLKAFPKWLSGRSLAHAARTTSHAMRLTGRRKIALPEQSTEETYLDNTPSPDL
jgi:hypothetical protein